MVAKGSVMGRDPAVSWVFNDWQGGTMTLSRFQKGCYMDLLTAQFNNGHLTLEEIKNVLGNDFAAWGILSKKFKSDSEGKFFNERLEFEILKRKKFVKSRKDNLNGDDFDDHMGNENGKEKGIEFRKENFIHEATEKIKVSEAEIELLNDFIGYWTEHSANGKKMRFESEAVFGFKRRWYTWVCNDKKFNKKDKKENGTTTSKTTATISSVNELLNKRGIDPGDYISQSNNL